MYTKAVFIFALTLGLLQIAMGQTIPVDADTGKGYLVGPGDEITGKILGEPQFDFITSVDGDGKIEIPFFDQPIMAKCLSERELRTEVTKLLSRYLKNPQLSLRVTARNSRPPATIYGEVKTPGKIELTRRTTLLEVLSFSGGVTEDAGGMIEIVRTQPLVCAEDAAGENWAAAPGVDPSEIPSRMYSLSALRLGNEDANPDILPGDVILVQKASPVYITGEVQAPQGIYLKEGGLSLSEAIAKIGGVRREAKTKDIKVYRLKPNSKDRDIISANYDLIRKGEQKDIMLQPYDIVEVDKSKKSIGEIMLELVTGAARTAAGGFGQLPTRVLY